MAENPIFLLRDIKAIQIPNGNEVQLRKGNQVVVTQSLGGSFTLHVAELSGLYRVTGQDADALGLTCHGQTAIEEGKPLEEQVWDMLKTCYDPEIPVNIVDLGLIYSLDIRENAGGRQVGVKMTLTAPGCGMGPSIAADARQKIMSVKGVTEALVEVVWEPPWNPSMITPEGKSRLGIES